MVVGIVLMIGGSPSMAQDFNFSQFNSNRTFYNPAFTGIEKGVFRGSATYRKMWPNFPSNFSTQFVNLEAKSYNAYGIGLFAISNREGDGFLKTNTLGASYSWQGSISELAGSFFQLGINASYNMKEIDFNQFTFSDELDEIYGDIYSTSFSADINKQNYWDFTVGALVQFPTIRRHRKIIIHTMGFALHHFTRPKDSFLDKDGRLPLKLTLHSQSSITTRTYSFNKEDRLRIIPSLVYQIQGEKLFNSASYNNLLYGVDIQSDPVFGGIWYSSQVLNNSKKNFKAVIFQFGVKLLSDNKKYVYRLSYSYDMSISKLSSVTQGAHEISLSVDLHFPARYKYNIFSF